jgi:HicB-like antitoxin of HicAB toxin-antitoxin system
MARLQISCPGRIGWWHMLTSSRHVKGRLEQDGWILTRVSGSHHVFLGIRKAIEQLYCHTRRKTWGADSSVISIGRLDGSLTESGSRMLHYVAVVEDEGPDKAIGIWFPDLPGCFSAGDDVMRHCTMLKKPWRSLPKRRSMKAALFRVLEHSRH